MRLRLEGFDNLLKPNHHTVVDLTSVVFSCISMVTFYSLDVTHHVPLLLPEIPLTIQATTAKTSPLDEAGAEDAKKGTNSPSEHTGNDFLHC